MGLFSICYFTINTERINDALFEDFRSFFDSFNVKQNSEKYSRRKLHSIILSVSLSQLQDFSTRFRGTNGYFLSMDYRTSFHTPEENLIL